MSLPISDINSLSSSLIRSITLYRNQPGIGNKCLAQAGYAFNAVLAAVESVAASIFCAGSLALYPFSPTSLEQSVNWLASSNSSIYWSIVYFGLNPFLATLDVETPVLELIRI